MTNIKIFFSIIGLLVLGGVAAVIIQPKDSSAPSKYGPFAQCLKDKGAVFYGAFWCPHCKAQKAIFGDAVKFLPYVECSTPNGGDQTQICKDKKIESYPTWELADGVRLPVENSSGVSFETLAEKTGCVLPE